MIATFDGFCMFLVFFKVFQVGVARILGLEPGVSGFRCPCRPGASALNVSEPPEALGRLTTPGPHWRSRGGGGQPLGVEMRARPATAGPPPDVFAFFPAAEQPFEVEPKMESLVVMRFTQGHGQPNLVPRSGSCP